MKEATRKHTGGSAQDSAQEPTATEQGAGATPEDGATADGPAAEQSLSQPEATADASAAPQKAASGGGAEQELNALRDRYLRLAAEYDNYRKRVEREKAESWNRAQAQFAEKLLEVLDDLQRVAHYNPETATAQSLLEGAQMVERKLTRALETAGVETIDAEGQPFDPSIHEALMMVPTETREEDHIVADVFQKGYRFKGTLLRPARVRVKKFEG
ncbi:MAG TPA: nucleotide exchange factor GrpE [Longimicrobiaceae bacterium]|nr:nucleotide exchange factor GrpE [Longimicrobiaceae bacterium]